MSKDIICSLDGSTLVLTRLYDKVENVSLKDMEVEYREGIQREIFFKGIWFNFSLALLDSTPVYKIVLKNRKSCINIEDMIHLGHSEEYAKILKYNSIICVGEQQHLSTLSNGMCLPKDLQTGYKLMYDNVFGVSADLRFKEIESITIQKPTTKYLYCVLAKTRSNLFTLSNNVVVHSCNMEI